MINRFIIYFFIMSFIGYIYECIAMIIWTGKWDNRGFLYGPIIPIYGAGALIGTIVFNYFLTDASYLQVFLIGMIGSAILEYIVHYELEKIFNAYWWDYSKSPLNINGRICLPASIGFGIAALIIIYLINPILLPIINKPNQLFIDILAIILIIICTIDFTLTISALSNLINRVEAIEEYIDNHMEDILSYITNEDKGINTKFYNSFDKLEEKEKIIKDRLDKLGSSMSGFYKNVLYNVKGFRGKNSKRLNYLLDRVKQRITRSKQ